MYLFIAVGVIIDKLLKIDDNPVTRARTCLVLGFAYNEVVSITSVLKQSGLHIPKGLNKFLDNLKHKGDD